MKFQNLSTYTPVNEDFGQKTAIWTKISTNQILKFAFDEPCGYKFCPKMSLLEDPSAILTKISKSQIPNFVHVYTCG